MGRNTAECKKKVLVRAWLVALRDVKFLHACLAVKHVQLQILPAAADSAHDLLRGRLPAGPAPGTCQRRETTRHNPPRERIRERIRRSDLFPLFRDRPERRVDTFNEQPMGDRVHDRCDLGVQRIPGIRRDIRVRRLVRVQRRGIRTRARTRAGWSACHRSIAIARRRHSPWQGHPRGGSHARVYRHLLCPRLQCRLGCLRPERHAALHCVQGALWAIERHGRRRPRLRRDVHAWQRYPRPAGGPRRVHTGSTWRGRPQGCVVTGRRSRVGERRGEGTLHESKLPLVVIVVCTGRACRNGTPMHGRCRNRNGTRGAGPRAWGCP